MTKRSPLRFRLRDYLPRGLYWRTALIVIVPAAVLQLIVTLVFLDDHWRFTSKRLSDRDHAERLLADVRTKGEAA